MRKVILRRLAQNVILVVVIVLVVFVLMRLTAGDPARVLARIPDMLTHCEEAAA